MRKELVILKLLHL